MTMQHLPGPVRGAGPSASPSVPARPSLQKRLKPFTSRQWTLVALLLATAVIAVSGSRPVAYIVGGATILAAAITGARAARQRAFWSIGPCTLLDHMTLWLPGFIALLAAAAGLLLAVHPASGTVLRALGLVLFTAELAMIFSWDPEAAIIAHFERLRERK